MGAAVPQVITETKASGAQVVDGSLKFDSVNKSRIDRTATSGSVFTWTLSLWVKKQGNDCHVFGAGDASTDRFGFGFNGSDKIFAFVIDSNSTVFSITTNAVFRDIGWYHIVLVADTKNGTQADRFKVYVNGVLQTVSGTLMPDSQDTKVNSAVKHTFGRRSYTDSDHFSGQITNAYLIDGQALDPENFGFTDSLTNTWRPKKYTGSLALGAASSFSLADNDFTWSGTRSSAPNDPDSGVLTDGNLGYTDTFWGNNGANGSYLDIDMTGASAGETFLIRYWNAAEAGGQTITATCKQIDSGGSDISGTAVAQTWNQGQKWNDGNGYITQTIQSNTSKIRLIFSNNNNNNYGWGIGEVEMEQVLANQNSFYLPMDGNSPIGQDKSGRGNDWTPKIFGNTNKIDSPDLTGGTPLLNTNEAGTVALPGYFGQNEYRYYTVTASGGEYYIDGDQKPTLNMIRGAKYVFDYSGATSHPFRFATAADAAGSTQYTTGTVVSGSTITFTVPHDAPSTLYYYCTNHSGMGNSISVTTDTKRADPYAQNLVCALPLTGAEGDNDFVDIGWLLRSTTYGAGKTFTAFTGNSDGGGTTSTRGSVFYGSSFYTTRGATNSNAGDYIERTGDADLSMGTGDYCIEFWFHPYNMETNDVLIDTRHPTTDWPNDDNGIMIYINEQGDTAMVSDGVQISGSNIVGKNQDNHFALTREGTTERFFVNGNLVGTATGRSNDYNRQRLHLGSSAPNGEGSSGYYNDLRVYKGVAKYTSPFKVGSPNPTVLPDTPSGVSGGSKLAKISDGAVTFNGSSDYLSVDGPGTLAASSNWCMECFFYCTGDDSGTYRIMSANESDQSSEYILMRIRLGQYQWSTDTANSQPISTVAFNKWTHMAFTKEGTTVRGFVDGKMIWETTDNNTVTITDLIIGWGYGGEYFPGIISNARFVNGSSVYTTDFKPPTEPLTNITNTYLLCCQSKDSAAIAAVTPNVPGSGINDGTIWSSGVSASTGTMTSPGLAFDADTSTSTYANDSSSNTSIFVDFSTAISGAFKLWTSMASGSRTAIVTHNGGTTSVNLSSGENSLGTFTSVTRIAVNRGEAATHSFNAIAVDNVQLLDPVAVAGNAAATTFNPFNTNINTVRGQETGYATLNPLKVNSSSSIVLSDGNLRVDITGNYFNAVSTLGMSSGKFYCETSPVRGYSYFGIATGNVANNTWGGDATGNVAWVLHGNGSIYHNNSTTNGTGFPSTSGASGYTLGLLFDADNKTMRYVYNGAISKIYNMANTVDGDSFYYFIGGDAGSYEIDVNFGQKPFKYAPPDGFQPLNAANVRPETVIARPDQYVGVTTYTGNGTAQTINVGLEPDFVWYKSRGGAAGGSHFLFDTVRGATKYLRTNSTDQENTYSNALTAFTSDGFSVGDHSSTNYNNDPYVAWTWKAGGSKNTFNVDDVGYASAAAAGLDGGSTNPTAASVNTKSKFGIYTFDGNSANRTLSHGLGQQPDFMIVKKKSASGNSWVVWHKSIANDKYLILNNTNALDTDGTLFNTHTSDSNTLWTLGSNTSINENGQSSVAYLWCDVPGLQKFGSYKGLGGTANGSFVELGFRPALVWVKDTSNGNSNSHWCVFDNLRPGFNKSPAQNRLHIDSSDNEDPDRVDEGNGIDIVSNGFRVRSNNWYETNVSSGTYIYCAWAETPSVNLYGAQSNAR